MRLPKARKPATARHGEPAPKIVGSGGRNDSIDIETRIALQAARLARQCAISSDMAIVMAPFVYGAAA